ncbi:ABC transporter substrate-binding protein [Dermacoccaceae bacterium W4C1]
MTSLQKFRALSIVSISALALSACGSSPGESETKTSGAAAGASSAAAGGSSDSAASATRSFKDDVGTVSIPTQPKRIVATGYAVPALLEADAPLVGISSWQRGEDMMSSEVKSRYTKTTRVAGESAKETNYEAIAKAKPDVIIIGVPQPVLKDIDLKRLKSIAPVVALGPSKPDAWKTLTERQLNAAGLTGHLNSSKQTYTKKANELKTKYASALSSMKFGHVGAYSDPAKGSFQHEFAGSWGTNIAQDIGVNYYGEVKKKSGGSSDVAEISSIEELPASYKDADAITYTVNPDGSVPPSVQYVLNSNLWKQLPAVKAGKTFPVRYSAAATYTQAMFALNDLDKTLAPLLKK